MRPRLPQQGRSRSDIFDAMRALARNDVDWRRGRVPLYVFRANEAVYELGRDAFVEFFTENALGSKAAFAGIRQMEEEVVAMALDLFSAPEQAVGNMTSGGSESIFMAVKACRDWTRARRGERWHRGNIVLPYSAHPAFSKAAHVLDLELRRVPVGTDLRADVPAMAKAIDRETIMLVGSAPCFPYGVVDAIPALGTLAQERALWLHVDACVGGYLAPFVKRLGHAMPDFDFAVPGVASISADLHKFGFAPKPASTVFYRDPQQMACQTFDFDDWPRGRFVTQTLTGTRPGGAVAAAWATMQHLGVAGYMETAKNIMATVAAYRAGVEAVGLTVWGDPDLSIISFGSRELDIFRVAETMQAKGWLPGLLQEPRGMHLMLSMLHAPVREEYLADLAAAAKTVASGPQAAASLKATY